MDGMLLETVEALGDSPMVGVDGDFWARLQTEKEDVAHAIVAEGQLLNDVTATNETEASIESTQQIEWRYRETLEDRLRAINDAQDRLLDGKFGVCLECGQRIGSRRLLADPTVALCIDCQGIAEVEMFACTL